MNKPGNVLISLHDVAPGHLERLQKAETCFKHWGLKAVSYLFIPDYHGDNDAVSPDLAQRFQEWAHRPRSFQTDWILHGYYHADDEFLAAKSGGVRVNATNQRGDSDRATWSDRFKKRWLTAGEGEFLRLSPGEINQRLKNGVAIFRRTLGFKPGGFVAPAWLFNEHLIPALSNHGFWFTEDHRNIYLLGENGARACSAPTITWATRTPTRKRLSIIGCPWLLRWWSHKPLIRLAMHPFDFDHPETVRSIEHVLMKILQNRRPALYNLLTKQPAPA